MVPGHLIGTGPADAPRRQFAAPVQDQLEVLAGFKFRVAVITVVVRAEDIVDRKIIQRNHPFLNTATDTGDLRGFSCERPKRPLSLVSRFDRICHGFLISAPQSYTASPDVKTNFNFQARRGPRLGQANHLRCTNARPKCWAFSRKPDRRYSIVTRQRTCFIFPILRLLNGSFLEVPEAEL